MLSAGSPSAVLQGVAFCNKIMIFDVYLFKLINMIKFIYIHISDNIRGVLKKLMIFVFAKLPMTFFDNTSIYRRICNRNFFR